MRHSSLPQKMTPERLGEWIDLNKVDTKDHSDKIDYTEEEIREFEHQSSAASRAIDKLTDVLDYVKGLIKNGTPFDHDQQVHKPVNATIPPTKGQKSLEANRKFADEQIERGYRIDITKIYLVPNPEDLRIIAVTIEGEEWEQYSRDMTKDEVKQWGKPLLTTASGEVREVEHAGQDEKGRMMFSEKPAEEKKKKKAKDEETLDI